jgi:hypothetical protein
MKAKYTKDWSTKIAERQRSGIKLARGAGTTRRTITVSFTGANACPCRCPNVLEPNHVESKIVISGSSNRHVLPMIFRGSGWILQT